MRTIAMMITLMMRTLKMMSGVLHFLVAGYEPSERLEREDLENVYEGFASLVLDVL